MKQKVVLGTLTFSVNPDRMTVIKSKKYASVVQTYSSAVFFSWGMKLVGLIALLEWTIMPEADWDSLVTMEAAEQAVVLDPKTGKTYNVEIVSLNGKYIEKSLAEAPYRADVKLELMIKSEVA